MDREIIVFVILLYSEILHYFGDNWIIFLEVNIRLLKTSCSSRLIKNILQSIMGSSLKALGMSKGVGYLVIQLCEMYQDIGELK